MKTITLLLFACIVINCTAQLTSTVIYNFEGTATDLSDNGNDGTAFGGATTVHNLKLFNNNTDYLTVPADAIDGLDDFTISFRIKFAVFHTTGSFPTNHIFSGSRSGCVQCFGFSYEKVMDVWKLAFNGAVYTWDDADLEERTWYCVSLVRTDGTIKFYVEGEEMPGSYFDDSEIDITSFVIGQEDDCVGGCFVTNQSMYGRMDNFQVWDGFHFGCNYNAHTKESAITQTPEIISDFTIYPNPANNYILIESKNPEGGFISIVN
ncbi:MAG: hypothetical protein H7X71_00550, partial [Chitinophagales bacterium]|nr:hypothetical protein [Chitinophagales bacterium]